MSQTIEDRVAFSEGWETGYRGSTCCCWLIIDGHRVGMEHTKMHLRLKDKVNTLAKLASLAFKEVKSSYIMFLHLETKKEVKEAMKELNIKNFSIETEWYGERFDVWVESVEDCIKIYDKFKVNSAYMGQITG